jgi:hypothetical protein
LKRRVKSHLLALLGAHHILHVSGVRVYLKMKVNQSYYRPGEFLRVAGD